MKQDVLTETVSELMFENFNLKMRVKELERALEEAKKGADSNVESAD